MSVPSYLLTVKGQGILRLELPGKQITECPDNPYPLIKGVGLKKTL